MADFDKVIPPGKEGNIHVKIHGTKIYPGEFRKKWTVTTNDPENTKVILQVSGKIEKVFNVSKELSMAGFANEKFDMETIITNLYSDPIHLKEAFWDEKSKDVKIMSDKLAVEIEEIIEPPQNESGRRYRLKVLQKERIPPGHYMSELILKTDFEGVKEKKLRVRLTVTPDVEVHPRTLYIGEMRVTEGTSRSFEKTFRVVAARGDSLKVLGVIPDREDMTISMKEVTPGRAYRGLVVVRPPSELGPYNGSLRVITNYTGYEELVVTVKGLVRTGVPQGE